MIRLDAEARAQRADLQRQIKVLEGPATAEQRALRKANRKARSAAIGKPAPGQREERELEPGYLAYLRRQPCQVGPLMGDPCEGRIDPAHLRFTNRAVGRINPGMGRKSHDRFCLSACRKHHDAQHRYGNEAKWWAVEVRADPDEIAARQHAEFNGLVERKV